MPKIIFNHFTFVLLFFALGACSSNPPKQLSNHLDTQIANTRVVLIGETHTDFGHHLNQLDVIRKSAQKWGGCHFYRFRDGATTISTAFR